MPIDNTDRTLQCFQRNQILLTATENICIAKSHKWYSVGSNPPPVNNTLTASSYSYTQIYQSAVSRLSAVTFSSVYTQQLK